MTVYRIFDGISAAQVLPPQAGGSVVGSNLPSGVQAVNLSGGGAVSTLGAGAAVNQVFQLTVTGTVGQTVSGTAQIIASNDGINWTNIGTVTASSGPSPNIQSASGTVPWAFFSGLLLAITGTGAKASLIMNA